jgi:glycosyltransferase involved in cell wall biosynthesis
MGEVKPKIALVHDFLTVYAGAERVLSAFHEMYPEAPIYTMFANDDVVAKHFPKATIITSPLQKSIFRSRPWLLLSRMPQAVESYNLSQFNIVLSSSGAFSHGVITGPETKHISYCHSPMRYAWDWHADYLREKNMKGLGKEFIANYFLSKIRLWDAVSAKRVDTWIANSSVVASRIKHFYRADAKVVYPPIDTDFFSLEKADKTAYTEPYVISVCRLSKNKRVDQIIAAAHKLGIHLLIGGSGAERYALESHAKKLSAKVTFLGDINEEEKRALIAGAKAFVFAAEDDFGIAPVEALALGVPVVALGKGGATESVQDGKNGFLYPEENVESLTKALNTLLQDGVSMDAAAIRKSSLAFSTEHFQKNIRSIVDHA